jgi:predicted kinase
MMAGAVIIMRGIPGSGKSTFAKQKYPSATVCSADHYFTDREGNYSFDIDYIQEAHEHCREEFAEAIALEEGLIVVDNTNLSMNAMEYYINKAKVHNYYIVFVRMVVPVDVAIKRNIHDVPPETIEHFEEIMEELPKELAHMEVKIKSF